MLWFAYFLAVVNAVIIGLSFLFIKVAVSHASPIDTLSFRFIIALVFCVIYMKLAKIPIRIDFKRILSLLLLAVFYPLGFFTSALSKFRQPVLAAFPAPGLVFSA